MKAIIVHEENIVQKLVESCILNIEKKYFVPTLNLFFLTQYDTITNNHIKGIKVYCFIGRTIIQYGYEIPIIPKHMLNKEIEIAYLELKNKIYQGLKNIKEGIDIESFIY